MIFGFSNFKVCTDLPELLELGVRLRATEADLREGLPPRGAGERAVEDGAELLVDERVGEPEVSGQRQPFGDVNLTD